MKNFNFSIIFIILFVLFTNNLNIFAMEGIRFYQTEQFYNIDHTISVTQSAAHNPIEDKYLISLNQENNFQLFAVFDGHIGEQVSNFLKLNLEINLIRNLSTDTNPARALFKTLKELNQQIFEQNLRGGSTANIVLKINQKLYVANVGDSRSVLNVNGTALDLSQDQKASKPGEIERIIDAGGFLSFAKEDSTNIEDLIDKLINYMIYKTTKLYTCIYKPTIPISFVINPQNLDLIKKYFKENYSEPINSTARIDQIKRAKEEIFSIIGKTFDHSFILKHIIDKVENYLRLNGILLGLRSFGDKDLYSFNTTFNSAEPEIKVFDLTTNVYLNTFKNQYFVIASDGLWDVMESQEVIDLINSSPTFKIAQLRLIEKARRAGSKDDITIMIIDLK